jgi:lysophospholipase L1-like esterase
LLTLFMAFSLVGVELVLRFFDTSAPKLKMMRENPSGKGSFRLKPGTFIETRVGGRPVRISINTFGMNWREVSQAKPEGKKRVAFVGDSFTFGCWADEPERGLVGVFERAYDSEHLEALNFGVTGYGPQDVLLYVREEILSFLPDEIVYVFWCGNDFGDAAFGLDKYDVDDGTITWHVEGQKGWTDHVRRFAENLKLYRAIKNIVSLLQARAQYGLGIPVTPAIEWSRTRYGSEALKAKDAAFASIGALARLCQEHGIRLTVVAAPFQEQVYAPRMEYPGVDFQLPQKYLEIFCRDEGIDYFDLLPGMRERAASSRDPLFISGDVHLNNAGHQATGTLLAGYFINRDHS